MSKIDKNRYIEELKYRLTAESRFFSGSIPERVVILWKGYLAAILETSVVSFEEYKELLEMLPKIENDPTYDLFTGRQEEADEEPEGGSGTDDAPH